MLTLIRRELLDNLMTFRFAAAVFITMLLVVANTAVLIRNYEQRLESYNTAVKTHQQKVRDTKTYSAGDVIVDRAPNPLSIFNVGLDKRLGNQVAVHHGFVPTLWDAEMHGSDTTFLNIFFAIDIVFVFEVVLSLMALLFAYDAIAGEHESGTLRLLLTHPVHRSHILLAKYMSAMVCLLIPLLMSLSLAVILLTGRGSIFLKTADFLRIGGIVFSSIAYMSVFYLIGLLISAVVRRTGTALMVSMFVWGFLVLVYPNMILAALEPLHDSEPRAKSVFSQIQQMWEEFDTERKAFLINDPVQGESTSFGIGWVGYNFKRFREDSRTLRYYYKAGAHFDEIDERSQPKVPYAQNYYRFLVPLTISTAERTWIVRSQGLKDIFVQPAKIDRTLLKLSPVGIYDAATQAWAGTDLLSIQDFFDAARQYRQTVIDYFYDKEVFESRQWFSADKGAADWRTLPQFSFQRSDIEINAKRALPDVCLLLMINVALFIITFLIFVKSEV
ncbi:MAG: ABC transporter permease subunit [Candidatus Poribacteria bacterium]|nr:ABC transporter permease subunit [Candidatus Poribacteria bacterium]